jgi:hypothetical protein
MRKATMPRSMVGLLAAVGTTMPVVASLAHGGLFWTALADGAAATGLAAYLALGNKKSQFLLLLACTHALKLALTLLRARVNKTLSSPACKVGPDCRSQSLTWCCATSVSAGIGPCRVPL